MKSSLCEILLFRHAKPIVSDEEIISGRDFPEWVERYDNSDIEIPKKLPIDVLNTHDPVLTSDLKRSWRTGQLFSENFIRTHLLREAELPLIRFPSIPLRTKYWLFLARVLWLSGAQKDCESYRDARIRACQFTKFLSECPGDFQRILIAGHGFFNHMLKRHMIKHGWAQTKKEGDGYLGARYLIRTHS